MELADDATADDAEVEFGGGHGIGPFESVKEILRFCFFIYARRLHFFLATGVI